MNRGFALNKEPLSLSYPSNSKYGKEDTGMLSLPPHGCQSLIYILCGRQIES